jgi:hypothetical protein
MKSAQLKFRLANYLRDLIEEAGERNGWGASEEIRARLGQSFEPATTRYGSRLGNSLNRLRRR